jgi:PAS domain-containing protein
MWSKVAVAAVAALLGGGLLSALAAWAGVPGTIYRDLAAQLEIQRTARREAESQLQVVRAALVAGEREITELRKREGRLFRSVSQLADANGLGEAFDHCDNGIVFSLSENGGTWTWVNRVMCEQLGLSRDEVLSLGWRSLIHPDDLSDAAAVESKAWDSSVAEYVVRYRRSPSIGGGYVRTRWWCPAYRQGRTVCVVKFGSVENEPTT